MIKTKLYRIASAIAMLLCCTTAWAGKGLAIVIDSASYTQARQELAGYTAALQQCQGYTVYTVLDRWHVPDSIRATLQSLYKQKHIVGAVLIGDIPVAMVRDGQHLTSAFKMDQKYDWRSSSVPSDRFYDDFGLSFHYLRKDSVKPYFYYSLTAQGNQRLSPSIFSGRIRPTDAGGTSRYEKLRAYLRKATAAKRHPEQLNSVFTFNGKGSISDSKPAHLSEFRALLEHLPHLANMPNAFSYMNYADAKPVRYKLMDALMMPNLSLAMLHHHGDWDTQYLGVGTDNLTLATMDSCHFAPNARLVVFDACFNGSFQLDSCVASRYIFSSGKTVAALAASVNVIQDKQYDKLLGLLPSGAPVGYINQHAIYLESHVIGDPTFCFAPNKGSNNCPDAQVLKMELNPSQFTDARLLRLLRQSPYGIVRLQAFTLMIHRNSKSLNKAIEIALNDNYEMLQRFAVNAAIKVGDPALLPAYARILAAPNASRRVKFNAVQGVQFFNKDSLLAAVNKELDIQAQYVSQPKHYKDTLLHDVNKYAASWDDDIAKLCAGSMDKKHALTQASYMRIYCPPHLLPQVARYTQQCNDDDVKQALLEAMGWHRLAYTATSAIDAATSIYNDPSCAAQVKQEALKTLKRLKGE